MRLSQKSILTTLVGLGFLAGVISSASATTTNFTTAGNITWTCPAGISNIAVECYGGGGGGGGTVTWAAGGGGGGGSYVSNSIAVLPGTNYNLTVGAGGSAGNYVNTGSSVNGGVGGSSFFGNSSAGLTNGAALVAVGGLGGYTCTNGGTSGPTRKATNGAPQQITGNIAGGGLSNYGQAGQDGVGGNAAYGGAGGDGAGPTGSTGGGGGGGQQLTSNSSGNPGTPPGGGGGGSMRSGASGSNGGAGAVGQVVITYRLTPTATLVVTNSPVTYNGNSQAAGIKIVTSSVSGNVTNVQYNGSTNLPVTVGTYAVTADFVPTNNVTYNTLTGLSVGNFVITKATPTASLAVNNSPTTYDGNPHAATVVILSSSTPGSVSNVLTGGAASQTAMGIYAVTANFVPADTTDYNTLTNQSAGSFEITGSSGIFYSLVGPFTYNATAQSPVVNFTGSTGARTTSYVGVSVSYNSLNAPTNPGTYYITNTLAADANYDGATNSQTFTINLAPLTIRANNAGKLSGQTLTFAGTEFTTSPSPLYGSDSVTSVTLTSAGAPANALTNNYPIIPSAAVGSGLSNYSITYSNGILSVTNLIVSIGAPTYASFLDSTAPNYNLTLVGTRDWQVYGDNSKTYTLTPSNQKLKGTSITLQPAVIVSPCVGEQNSARSQQNFTWTDGRPNLVAINSYGATPYDPTCNGFSYASATTASFYANSETLTFLPGDTLPHTIHLYGYVAGSTTGLSLQFSNYLAGAGATVFTTNPPLGDFDYSLTFQADSPTKALTVTWTFQSTNSAAKYLGVTASAMSGYTPLPPVVNWRVIPDDTNYPSDSVLMAAVVYGDTNFCTASNLPPANPATQDCSTYVQAAINWLSYNGGGTIYFPPGHYCFSNNITLIDRVTLRGRWVKPGPNQPVTGTIFDIYANEGNSAATPFLTGSGTTSSVRELAFWYPNQNPTTWVPYPWTLYCPNAGMKSVQNVTFVNSYLGYDCADSADQGLRGMYGTSLLTGIYADRGASVPRFEDAHFAPDYWVWSGLPGAPTDSSALISQMQSNTNSIGFDIAQSAGMNIINCSFSGYYYGFHSVNLNGTCYGFVATNCVEALLIDSGADLRCINCDFRGTTYGYHRLSGQGASFYGCNLAGGIYSAYEEAAGPFHDFYLNASTLVGAVNVGRYSSPFNMIGSSFAANTPTNVILNGVGTAQIVSVPNANCGTANVQLNGTPGNYMCSTNGFVPLPPATFPFSYGKTRKPDKAVLFDVTSTNFAGGAWGDGMHDDTAAIQATIQAAQTNGGGIVMFPAGLYIVSAPLSASNGVELRGINGAGLSWADDEQGSMIQVVTGMNQTNDPAFITLGDRCGIWGLNFNYPIQSWQTGYVAYPYTIECRGVSNYLIGCSSGASYHSVDMNGANGGLLDYCHFNGFVNIFRVRNGATDCRYMNSHAHGHTVNSTLWTNGPVPPGNMPSPLGFTEDHFIAEDCTNFVIYSVYAHMAHTLVTVRGNASVNVFMINGEQMQRGYVLESGGGSVYALDSGSNINNSGDGNGAYDWWLGTNYTGAVTDVAMEVNISIANYGVRVDNSKASWTGYFVPFRDALIWNLKAAGSVSLVGGYLSQCSLDVPAGGRLTASQSRVNSMPYVSQAGTVNFSTNCLWTAKSFIAADLNDVPYTVQGITVTTNNLMPVWDDGTSYYDANGNPQTGAGNGLDWTLASGNTFSFHVTSPYFTNGVRPNVTITASASGIPTNGSLTVSYHSTSGMKTMSGLSATVTDARFAAPNGVDILLTASNCTPLVNYLAVYASSNMGVAPQLLLVPVANFTATPTNGIRPLAVTFTDTSSGSITNLLWNFGDGQTTNTAASAVVAHTYQTNGTYTVSLKASGAGGSNTNTQTGLVTVLVPNPPQIGAITSFTGNALVLQGSGGPTNGSYYYWLRSSTNLTLPLTNWSIVATNAFDAYGSFSNQIPLLPGAPQTFYRIQMP